MWCVRIPADEVAQLVIVGERLTGKSCLIATTNTYSCRNNIEDINALPKPGTYTVHGSFVHWLQHFPSIILLAQPFFRSPAGPLSLLTFSCLTMTCPNRNQLPNESGQQVWGGNNLAVPLTELICLVCHCSFPVPLLTAGLVLSCVLIRNRLITAPSSSLTDRRNGITFHFHLC